MVIFMPLTIDTGGEPMVSIEQEDMWTGLKVWTLWRRNMKNYPVGNRTKTLGLPSPWPNH